MPTTITMMSIKSIFLKYNKRIQRFTYLLRQWSMQRSFTIYTCTSIPKMNESEIHWTTASLLLSQQWKCNNFSYNNKIHFIGTSQFSYWDYKRTQGTNTNQDLQLYKSSSYCIITHVACTTDSLHLPIDCKKYISCKIWIRKPTPSNCRHACSYSLNCCLMSTTNHDSLQAISCMVKASLPVLSLCTQMPSESH